MLNRLEDGIGGDGGCQYGLKINNKLPNIGQTIISAVVPDFPIASAPALRDIRSMALSFDPSAQSGSALPAAAQWIESLLYGSLGTSVAVIAVGWFGFEMLTGRLSLRRGGTLVLGCFIFFGAPSIARELKYLSQASGPADAPIASQQIASPPAPKPKLPPPYDPYAGAAVPGGGR